ncbi:unnamed protein product [Ilex paraguariensis]|uniref:Conserved oligomeric Golgi complex subunit 4 n=1 Tax=Ilex paraguariensis TaxID=185542 RepID=A0ABC8RUU6_9AQUA
MASTTPYGSISAPQEEHDTSTAINSSSSSSTVRFGTPEALEHVQKLTDVSGKVRQLDLAQSRVNDTLLRTDAIIKRGNCIDGVMKALQTEDFESAHQLEGIFRKRLSTVVDQRDHLAILRFIRVYSPLGLENQSSNSNPLPLLLNQNQVNFVACLKNLFKDIVLAIEENNEILRSNLYGEAGIVYAICELQDECDSRGSLILKKYMEYQKLVKLTFEINTSKGNLLSVGVQGPEPRDIELYLEEILQLKQLGKDYTNYIVSKIRGLSSVDPEMLPRATRAFRSKNFSKVVQDITGYYVILEGFFMVENVRNANSNDEHVLDSLTTSMVDNVFYVLQS